ncbi:MAG: hypothetical protein Q9218_004633, partial [Villophora microphyllina]
ALRPRVNKSTFVPQPAVWAKFPGIGLAEARMSKRGSAAVLLPDNTAAAKVVKVVKVAEEEKKVLQARIDGLMAENNAMRHHWTIRLADEEDEAVDIELDADGGLIVREPTFFEEDQRRMTVARSVGVMTEMWDDEKRMRKMAERKEVEMKRQKEKAEGKIEEMKRNLERALGKVRELMGEKNGLKMEIEGVKNYLNLVAEWMGDEDTEVQRQWNRELGDGFVGDITQIVLHYPLKDTGIEATIQIGCSVMSDIHCPDCSNGKVAMKEFIKERFVRLFTRAYSVSHDDCHCILGELLPGFGHVLLDSQLQMGRARIFRTSAEASDQWPPRSPYAALLSSPSGRSRVRRYQDRTSPSPSPLKKARITPGRYHMDYKNVAPRAPPEDDEDDEDEETLQLRLQALEAKLKLKQLQQKKAKKTLNQSDVENESPEKRPAISTSRTQATTHETDRATLGPIPSLPTPTRPVQVPASPQRRNVVREKPRSPGRVLLGIDKGLKGKNVSLKRVPETKRNRQVSDDPFLEEALSTVQKANLFGLNSGRQESPSKPKISFSERINEIRKHDKEQAEKAKRLQTQRSTGFGIGKEALESMKAATEKDAKAREGSTRQAAAKPAFTREEILKAARKPTGGLVHRDETARAGKVIARRKEFKNPNASPEFTKPTKPPPKPHSPSPIPASNPSTTASKKSVPTDPSLFEPFSSLHLSKRLIPHESLTKALTSKSILLLPDLLSTIKAPDYSLPDSLESDFVVLATIASKSSPLSHKDKYKTDNKAAPFPSTSDTPSSSLAEASESSSNVKGGKYMALTLTDLKWSLDLYLFTTAYTRFWRLTPGTVIAILNPSVMPPPPHNPHNNRFSLTLHSNDDTILEIGTARDLGWCESRRKDGKGCGTWIDKRHTSVCEFHIDQVVEKTRRGRMEINGTSASFGPGGRKSARTGFWGGGGSGGTRAKSRVLGPQRVEPRRGGGNGTGFLPNGSQWDRTNKSAFFVGGPTHQTTGFGGHNSAATLLDAPDDLTDRAGREERVRKRMAERERERSIARQLGEKGKGMGADYLQRSSHPDPSIAATTNSIVPSQQSQQQEPVDATSLGLLTNKSSAVQLSPIKKKKRPAGPPDACPPDTCPPRKKKTRFLTERGIKEAGRESLGLVGGVITSSSSSSTPPDEDELDIV